LQEKEARRRQVHATFALRDDHIVVEGISTEGESDGPFPSSGVPPLTSSVVLAGATSRPRWQVRVLPGTSMERRETPNIDTVREILREEDDRVREEPPPAPTEDDSDEAGSEDEADS
jgi:hypothetical protein